jgi:hypothetical protein
LGRVPNACKIDITSYFMSAWGAITDDIVAKTSSDRRKHWNHWCRYTSLFQVSHFLICTPPLKRDTIVCTFVARVHRGVYGKANTVKVQIVMDALSAISQTIQLVGECNPL